MSRWSLSHDYFYWKKEGHATHNGKLMSIKSIEPLVMPSEHTAKSVREACDRFFMKRQRMKDFEEYRRHFKANRHPISE
jgi:hypothetical protein